MNILLIRHGQFKNNGNPIDKEWNNLELNKAGIKQAELTANRLRKLNIDKIYCSNFLRTRQTAEIINKTVKSEILIKSEIREIDRGDFDIKSDEFLKNKFPDFFKKLKNNIIEGAYPNGESGEDVLIRASATLEEIKDKNFKNIVIVTHGGVIRILVSHILGLPLSKRMNLPTDNCGITKLSYKKEKNEIKVRFINDTCHLEVLKSTKKN